jgi:peroxidase
MLRGLVDQRCQMIDSKIVDDLRNSLFSSFDLASFNIQRGRDHGLPDYNTVREHFNLTPASTFADITSDIELQKLLQQAYGNVDDIDPWVGMICEDHPSGARIGELNYYIIKEQFEYLRDYDRFWYQIDPELQPELAWLNNLSLSQVIQYNTNINGLPANAFYAVPEPTSMVLALTALILIPIKKRFA